MVNGLLCLSLVKNLYVPLCVSIHIPIRSNVQKLHLSLLMVGQKYHGSNIENQWNEMIIQKTYRKTHKQGIM